MFGHDDDNQQPVQDNSAVLQAAMPDPIADTPLETTPTVASPTPSLSGAPSMSEPSTVTPSTPPSPSSVVDPSTSPSLATNSGGDDLLNLKQQALQHLSPLVGHLDQTPEEKFRTTMMMIQASDDQSLIKSAFESAQAIVDDKARAQALLDIINEINYFTQHKAQ